ncbi:MAG: DUF4912 domain-containing protein [Treponema sp.]|jgi:hypothetical protein|nr:DUF4912 domain-containing protein [Treponema sp.]
MDDPRITEPYLESLTTKELIKLADTLGFDIPPGLERIFIIEELLDFSAEQNAEEEESPLVLTEMGFLESVPLPKQYNITFIEVMLRDPLWVFVFWEVKAHDRERYENHPDFAGYQLRVSPLGWSRHEAEAASFAVSVGNEDTAWYLGFPPDHSGLFKVDLCVLRGGTALVLASSGSFRVPKLFRPPAEVHGENPLIRLSGAEDFQVLRSADRLSRSRRSCTG